MKETWKFIALMVVAVGCILGYAFIPEQVAEQMPLKQVGMEALTGKSEEKLAEEEAETQDTVKEEVDSTSQRVLIFGDSMSEYLAYRLSDYANKNGHSLTCVTWCSSGTRNWADTDTLNHYVQTVRPTHIFVCLGSNELYTADMKGCEKRIRAILSKIGNIPTVWIGPPNWCEDKGYNKLLLQVMGSKRYYPSYKLTFERQKDGRHPTMKASAMWMDKIVEWMNEGHSVHPFKLDKPTERNLHYRQVTILPPGAKHKPSAAKAPLTDEAENPAAQPDGSQTTTPAAGGGETATPKQTAPKHVERKDSI